MPPHGALHWVKPINKRGYPGRVRDGREQSRASTIYERVSLDRMKEEGGGEGGRK